jgi:hypothetical protein
MSTVQPTRTAARPLVLSLVTLCSCVAAAPADSLDGWWVSEGYGTLLEIKGDRIRASEVTAVSCLSDWTAKRLAESEGAEAAFRIDQAPITVLVTPGGSADRKFFGFKWAASRVGFRRVPERPAVCDTPTENTPLANFDVFWTTYAEHYPFFALHGVDWTKVRDTHRPKVTADTSPEALFALFQQMIEPLEDAHTFLSAEAIKKGFGGRRAGTDRLSPETRQRVLEIIENNYLRGKLKSWCEGRVSYGLLRGDVGYLRVTGFAGYTKDNDYDKGEQALNAALDEIFKDAGKWRGLVIDVRINGGGADPYGVAIASRLATGPYLAYAKRARSDPRDPARFTPPQETRVAVHKGPRFGGPCVLLTSGNSVSAAETFAMALMGRSPSVRRVGQPTQGVFSDVLGRKLPNGWRFGLPNEIYLTEDGKTFDGPGVPPHVAVPVFPKEDLEKGRDGALEKAEEILRGK